MVQMLKWVDGGRRRPTAADGGRRRSTAVDGGQISRAGWQSMVNIDFAY
jgi:hypothetical protein